MPWPWRQLRPCWRGLWACDWAVGVSVNCRGVGWGDLKRFLPTLWILQFYFQVSLIKTESTAACSSLFWAPCIKMHTIICHHLSQYCTTVPSLCPAFSQHDVNIALTIWLLLSNQCMPGAAPQGKAAFKLQWGGGLHCELWWASCGLWVRHACPKPLLTDTAECS